MMGKSVRTQCFDRPIKPQQIGWNANHGEWHLKNCNNKQNPNNHFSSSYLYIHTQTCYWNDPHIGRGTSYRHHINQNIHNKSLRTRDPSELVSLRWIAFSLWFSVSLAEARWKPIIFMKLWNVCLLLLLQEGGWHHEFVKQVETILNGSTKVPAIQGSCKWCSIIVVQYLIWAGGWWENTAINCLLFLTQQKWAIHSHPVANWLFNSLCKDFLVFSADRHLVCDPTNAFGGLQDDSRVKADLCDCFCQVGSLYLYLGGLLKITRCLYCICLNDDY